MKKLFPLLLPIVAMISCTQIKGPQFRDIGHFRVKSVDFSSANVAFHVSYFNPNNFGVTVKEAVADIYADSVYLGKFVQDSLVRVSKNAEFALPLSGAIPLTSIFQLDLKNLPKRNVLLRVEGSVKVGKAGIFISEPVHYSGIHRLDQINLRL